MKKVLSIIFMGALIIGLLDSCKENNGPEIPQQNLPEGALKGVFSVGDDGNKIKKVRFSQGNLYYNGSRFNFKAKQYETHGYDSASNSWGLFGWSTLSTNYGMSTSKSNGDYSGDFIDWGRAYCSQKTLSDSTWRTLTSYEWDYLLEMRTNAASKVGFATVGNIPGVIILPDIFSDPMKNSGNESGAFVPKSKSSIGWDKNVYTFGDNWNAMESAGAVFFPAAGRRIGSELYYVGDYGYYWVPSSNNSRPSCLWFNSSKCYTDTDYERHFGYSVRLVTDIK